jgi:hypothetical protein
MLHEGWACNPGSPENCDLNESLYDRDKDGTLRPRGYAWVKIDPTSGQPQPVIEIRSNPRRPVFRLSLDCTPLSGELKNEAAFEKAACELIASNGVPAEAAVVLRLTGKASFGRLSLDLEAVARNIEQAANVTAVFLDLSATEMEGPGSAGGNVESTLSREEVERGAIRGLVEEERLWGLDGEREAVARLFFELKEAVRANKSVDELAELVNVSPLIETIRATAAVPVETGAGPADSSAVAPPAQTGGPA